MPNKLPVPGPEAAQHSAQLNEFIRRDIVERGGWISFARYMELVLYAPGLGYYTAGAHKLGAAGDFVTAPELSPLFGRTLARQAAEIMAHSAPHILELGAGSGKLAADMLGELERRGSLPDSYAILEVSADLCVRQQVLLRERLPHLIGRVHWLDALPQKFSGAIIANEVLDALPVHLVHWRDSALSERGVALNPDNPLDYPCFVGARPACESRLGAAPTGHPGSNGYEHGFIWQERAINNAALLHAAQQIAVPDDYVSEICLAAHGLVNSLASCLEQGALLFIDYGFGAREFYHPQRRQRHADVPLPPPCARRPVLSAGTAGYHRAREFHRHRGRRHRCRAGTAGLYLAGVLPAELRYCRVAAGHLAGKSARLPAAFGATAETHQPGRNG